MSTFIIMCDVFNYTFKPASPQVQSALSASQQSVRLNLGLIWKPIIKQNVLRDEQLQN